MSLMALLSLFTLTSYVPHGPTVALLCLALVSVFTLTSYVPDGPTVLGPIVLALLSLFTLTSYVPDGPTDPGYVYCSWPYCPYSP